MPRLSDYAITRLRPKAHRYSVPDPVTPSLELRVTPTGVKSWSLRYRATNGKQVRHTLGAWPALSADDARRAATQFEQKDDRDKPLTLEQLVEEYLERWARPKRSTHLEDERVLTNVLIPFFGADLLANEIRRRDLSRWLDSMVVEGKRAAANRYYTIARRCFNWSVEVDLLDHSPTVGVRLPIRELPRERLITSDEVKALWNGLPKSPASQHAVRITLATALRIGEVVGARREKIDKDAWIIPATSTKARRVHVVPMTPMLERLLKDAQKDLMGGEYVFPTPQSSANGHLRARTVGQSIRKWLPQLTDVRVHDIRRLVGSFMAQTGVAMEVIQGVLGHARSGVTQLHYIHQEALVPRMRDALEAWQDRLQEILDE